MSPAVCFLAGALVGGCVGALGMLAWIACQNLVPDDGEWLSGRK